jgi:sugar lactone lactonase YvrE
MTTASILALLLAAQHPVPAQHPGSSWRGLRSAMAAALVRHDTTAYRDDALALQRLVGTTPRIAAGLAMASFALHDTIAGMRWTRALARMGMDIDTATVAQLSPQGDSTVRTLMATIAAARSTVDQSATTGRLGDPDMIAEDLAFDAARGRMLVSSVHRGTILAVDSAGRVSTFIAHVDGTWGIFALGVDAGRNTLWATTGAYPGAADYSRADSGKTALLEFDLKTGTLRHRFQPAGAGAQLLGDLTVTPNGTVYVSDGMSGAVYQLRPDVAALRPLVPPGTFSSPQTPALSRDGARLYVPDYSFGIAVITLATGTVRWLRHPDELALTGIDGLDRDGDGLIAVQNGPDPNRIIRLTLNSQDDVLAAATIARGGGATDLNHALVRNGSLWFIARSGWGRVRDDGTMPSGVAAGAPEIRKVKM